MMGSDQLTGIASEALSAFVEKFGRLWHGAGAVSYVIPDLCGEFAPGTVLQHYAPGYLTGIHVEHTCSGAFMLHPDSGILLVMEYAQPDTHGGFLELSRPFFMSSDFCFTKVGGIRMIDPEEGEDFICLRSPWLNVSDHLGLFGVYGGNDWGIYRDGSSDGKGRYRCRFIWSEDCKVSAEPPALDCAWLIRCGIDSGASKHYYEEGRTREIRTDTYLTRAVWLKSGMGWECVFAANFCEDTPGQFLLPSGSWASCHDEGQCRGTVTLSAAECGLWIKNA